MNWGERENELNKHIELSCGFGELRKDLDVFEEMKEGRAREEIERREKVGNRLPTIREESGSEMGGGVFGNWGKWYGSES